MLYMMNVDKEINLSAFHKSWHGLGFTGYKVMLRHVETGELRPVYHDEYRGITGLRMDFRYVVGESTKARGLSPDSEVHGICVFASLEGAQEWPRYLRTCWEDDMWPPVIVEVITLQGDFMHTGADAGSKMAVASYVFVKRIIEHLRKGS